MCKFNPKNESRRIDPCMRNLIRNLEVLFDGPWKTVACCCGHGKYPMTIVIKSEDTGNVIEICNDKVLPRTRRFYKRDKQGVYYIPECVKT